MIRSGIKHTYMSSGFFQISDKAAGMLAKNVGRKLPKHGHELRVVLPLRMPDGKRAYIGPEVWLSRTPSYLSKRGWVWAVSGMSSHS